ncbi:hypothetical protein QBC45DRAFT_85350 [Copromyces sp. CBS 386.78]|nr:hypothetical protein QBC45DRAFT_85350 [Copromyces sp. CBS 386.78]
MAKQSRASNHSEKKRVRTSVNLEVSGLYSRLSRSVQYFTTVTIPGRYFFALKPQGKRNNTGSKETTQGPLRSQKGMEFGDGDGEVSDTSIASVVCRTMHWNLEFKVPAPVFRYRRRTACAISHVTGVGMNPTVTDRFLYDCKRHRNFERNACILEFQTLSRTGQTSSEPSTVWMPSALVWPVFQRMFGSERVNKHPRGSR